MRAYVGYRTSDPDPPKSVSVTARYDGPRKTETDAEQEAWLLDEAQISEDELATRFEPEPDTTESVADEYPFGCGSG